MKLLILLPFSLLFLGCNSGSEKKPSDKPVDSTVTPGPAKDTTVPAPPTGKIDIESFGPLRLGQNDQAILKALEKPDDKSTPTEWGADGLMHEDWTWTSKGLVLNMSSEKENSAATLTVFSITATAPCTFKTAAGIGIGSTYEELLAAYPRDINKEESTREQVTVGSIYGGIIFTLRDHKVIRIFLGAAAE